jgi:hypothetical protein
MASDGLAEEDLVGFVHSAEISMVVRMHCCHLGQGRGIVGDRLPESDDLEIDGDSSELVLRAVGQSRVRVPLRFLVFRGP